MDISAHPPLAVILEEAKLGEANLRSEKQRMSYLKKSHG
jgi:hypothetical protein